MDEALHEGEGLVAGVRRLVTKMLDDAVDQLDRADDDAEAAVHGMRKRAKRVRGLVRLVRPALSDDAYHQLNDEVRDAARRLSELRDAHVALQTFDLLVAGADQRPPALAEVRALLVARSSLADAGAVEDADRRAEVQERLRLVRKRADELLRVEGDRPDPDAEAGLLARGMAKTYGRARQALRRCHREPAAEAFHELRKRVKYLRFQHEAIAPAAPSVLEPTVDLLDRLGDALGDDHDLVALVEWLEAQPPPVDAVLVGPVADLAQRAERQLRDGALSAADRAFVEAPNAFRRRIEALLVAWQRAGAEREPLGLEATLPPTDDLDELSTAALRDLARRRDLRGRSSLDRAGLLAALRLGSS